MNCEAERPKLRGDGTASTSRPSVHSPLWIDPRFNSKRCSGLRRTSLVNLPSRRVPSLPQAVQNVHPVARLDLEGYLAFSKTRATDGPSPMSPFRATCPVPPWRCASFEGGRKGHSLLGRFGSVRSGRRGGEGILVALAHSLGAGNPQQTGGFRGLGIPVASLAAKPYSNGKVNASSRLANPGICFLASYNDVTLLL